MDQIKSYAFLLLGLAFYACQPTTKVPPPDTDFVLPYHLDEPDTMFDLPPVLREISGLSMSSDGRQLLAVNDEQGLVFFLNPENGAIENKQAFGKSKDYEGLEAVGQDIYVVNSNGSVYQIPPKGETKRHATPLNGSYDVEGLCFDSNQNRLLLACKGIAGNNKSFRKKKAIYAFDLSKMELATDPVFLIDRTEIARWKGGVHGIYAHLNEFLATDQAPSAFSPSGLAVCPIDSNLYVVASVGKALAVLRPDGSLAYVQRLNERHFRQPEGICFDSQGRMYISSEGKNGVPGRIFRFGRVR